MSLVDFFYNIGIGGAIDSAKSAYYNTVAESKIKKHIKEANEYADAYSACRHFETTASGMKIDAVTGTSPASDLYEDECIYSAFLINVLHQDASTVKEAIQIIHYLYQYDIDNTKTNAVYVAGRLGIDPSHIDAVQEVMNLLTKVSDAFDMFMPTINSIQNQEDSELGSNDKTISSVYSDIEKFVKTGTLPDYIQLSEQVANTPTPTADVPQAAAATDATSASDNKIINLNPITES